MGKTFNTQYGQITYNENVWTGKKKIFIDGAECPKVGRNAYTFSKDNKTVFVSVKGNFLTGQKLMVDNQEFVIEGASKWYEITIAVLSAIIAIMWGSVEALVMIFPTVGGAIGGGVAGVMLFLSLFVMKKVNKPINKILIGIGFFIATMLILFALAMVFFSLVLRF